MGDRSLPPQVDGHPQGRLDVIFGRPAVFPPPRATQSFIFTFRWWGDTRPCILRLPPEKSEARITYIVTCGPQSFRQYLCDTKNLHVSVKIGGGENVEITENDKAIFGHHIQSPRRVEGETPRQKLFRRQLRLKKGWQDGDVIGSCILSDLKLNARGDYVHEGRIIDSSADIIGTVVVTMVFMEGTLEDFQQIKIQSEEETSLLEENTHEKTDDTKSRPRASGIPVLESYGSKTLKTPPQESYKPRSRSGSFRDSLRRKSDKLKSPKKQQQDTLDLMVQEKENQVPQRKRAASFTQVGREGATQQDKQQIKKHDGLQLRYQGNIQIKQEHSQMGQHDESQQGLQDNLQMGQQRTSQLKQQENSQVEHQEDLQAEQQETPQVVRRAIPQLVRQENSRITGLGSPQVVRRERRSQDSSFTRERPASWGLYPLLNGADPHSLVDSGAVKPGDLPILLEVLEGRSPNLDFSNLDPETQKLLDGLDLSMSFSGISMDSAGKKKFHIQGPSTENVTGKAKSHMYSVFKDSQKDTVDLSGLSMTSGVWPLEERKEGAQKSRILTPTPSIDKILAHDSPKFGSPQRVQQGVNVRTKIPSQMNRPPVKACRTLISRAFSEKKRPSPCKDISASLKENEELSSKNEKTTPSKYGSEDEGSVLVVDVGTLTLAPPLLPPKPSDKTEKISGVRVMHRSRVCYLTILDVDIPGLDDPSDWEMSQTCASRQLTDHEIHYNVREVLRLPPAPALDILRGQLLVRCVCRRLGERDSVEVGNASISLMDLWQLNGSQVQVPLFRSHIQDDKDSLTRKQGKKARKREEEQKEQSLAWLTFTARLGLAIGQKTHHVDGDGKSWNMPMKTESLETAENVSNSTKGKLPLSSKPLGENSYSEKLAEKENVHKAQSLSSTSHFTDGKYSVTDLREPVHYLKPKMTVPEGCEHSGSASFNSIYIPTHMKSPSEKVFRGDWQYPVNQGQIDIVESLLGKPHETKVASSSDSGFHGFHESVLAGINGYESSTNKPVESGGESPCIRTASEFIADFINYDKLSWRPGIELRREERGGACRVHLEILKGRNMPWLEGPDGTPRPPNCYVKTTIGSLNILTNVCHECDNPVWSFATDILLPYSQLTQTDGNLILKVHHTPVDQKTSLDDPLLGFVCVDATSIWSGHVSLCGWYPLLDLRGAVRGHVKVSLTPHEPPQTLTPSHWYSVSLQEQNSNYPPSGVCQSRHSYPQYTAHAELHSEAEHTYTKSDIGNSALGSLARSTNAIPQLSPRSHRKNYNQDRHGVQQHSASKGIYSSVNQTLDSSSYSVCQSVIDSGSVVDKHIVDNSSGSSSEASQLYTGVSVGTQVHSLSRKASSIPVFSRNRNFQKSPNHNNDKPKSSSVLPEVVYKEQENVCPDISVASQGYFKHKGSIIVKGPTAECNKVSHQMETTLKDTSNLTIHKHPSEREDGKGSVLLRDSMIVSDFQMQKDSEQCREGRSKEEMVPSNINPIGSKYESDRKAVVTSASRDCPSCETQPLVTDPKVTLSDTKPSSCLKLPGSPSLRTKHVTFAHKLVQQRNDAATTVHCSQDKINRKYQLQSQPSKTSNACHQEMFLDSNIQSTMEQEVRKTLMSRDKIPSQSMMVEGSDLQVVPCREGDSQAVTATVSVQGNKTLNAVAGYGTNASQDKNRADLIMAFSWMNQSSGCDTPCVSYIESKQTMQNNHESNGNCTSADTSSVDIRKATIESHSISLQKKSRKFRSRLAANFNIK